MRDFQTIQNTPYDLVVIGGGINGAAVARDAALRGLRTLLVEKGDFASGTTSCPTRLIHGGLRYLEYFEFNLVRESLREREILFQMAPHLVQPIQMTIPIYSYGSRSYRLIQSGMLLYDLLSYDKTVPSHRMLPARQVHQLFRALNPESLTGAAQYYDGLAAYAERLCLENILSAQAAGATTLNYVQVTQLQRSHNRITTLCCEDQLTDATLNVHCSDNTIVINTAGPWVDRVLNLGCQGDSNGLQSVGTHRPAPIGTQPKIGGTKGSHILVSPFPGAPSTALYVEATTDRRPFFIVPWLNLYLIGTTDFPFEGDLDRVKADNHEIDYLIAETNRVLPTAHLTREDVRFTYSGVRPLPYSKGQSPGSITRSHILFDHTQEGVTNLISLIGGKLTTHRQVGEECVDTVYRKLGRPISTCLTRHQPLPGSILTHDSVIDQAIATYRDRVSVASINHLFSLYGAKAPSVLALIDQSAALAKRIVPDLPDIKAQVVYAVQSEMAHTLVDICCRRTTLAMQANYGLDLLSTVAETLAEQCGWDEGKCDRQIHQYHHYIETHYLPDYAMKES